MKRMQIKAHSELVQGELMALNVKLKDLYESISNLSKESYLDFVEVTGITEEVVGEMYKDLSEDLNKYREIY